MKPLVRCKVCGYIMREERPTEVCPACGVPRKMFEPYQPNISPQRWQWLQLDLHPIVVHLPQAYVFTLLVLSVVALFATGSLRDLTGKTFYLLATCLPFILIGTALTGWLDGLHRFKKVTTPILQAKLALGVTLFLLSAILFFILQGWTGMDPRSTGMLILLSAATFICSFFLGLLGASITHAWLPGK